MDRLEVHRVAVDRALAELGLDWRAWPGVVADSRLESQDRLSALIVLLATAERDSRRGPQITWVDTTDDSRDWLGRDREPWEGLARRTLPWTAGTAALAIASVSRGVYDDRRVALALKGAGLVCADGVADAALLDALDACVGYLDSVGDEQHRIVDLRNRARRIIASATPPGILDLSLLADGDGWAEPAKLAARAMPADDVAPLVRLLGELGPHKPPQRWWRDVDQALRPEAARQLLRRWIELAAVAPAVPEWPDSQIGYCRGTLFVGTNVDVARAVVLATSRLRDADWSAEVLGVVANRAAEHNGMDRMPEALSLKVASAAVDALSIRNHEADRRVLTGLLDSIQRRDLLKRIAAALAP